MCKDIEFYGKPLNIFKQLVYFICVFLQQIMFLNKLFIYIVYLLFTNVLSAQDKLVLLNGRILEGKVTDLNDGIITFQYKKKKSFAQELIEQYRVYSIIDSSGKEKIVYIQDSLVGNVMNVADMGFFIAGEMDARKNFNPVVSNWIGFAYGLGIVTYDTYDKDFGGLFKANSPTILVFVPTFTYFLFASIPRITINVREVTHKPNLLQDAYIEGFARIGKIKRRMGGIKFSLGGTLLGLGTWAIVKNIK